MKASSLFIALLLSATIGSFAAAADAQNQNEDAASSRKVVSRVVPSYPQIARNMNLTGAVKLEVVVAANGSVKSIQVLGGSPVFAQPAQSAVREWKWEKTDHESTERVEVRFNP